MITKTGKNFEALKIRDFLHVLRMVRLAQKGKGVKMFKKVISLISAIGIAATFAIPASAAVSAGATADDISGNLIRYGSFDLASDVTGMLSDDGAWDSSKDFKYELNTNPANTYNNSWGSLKVTQNRANEQSERRPVLKLRRNQWYHLTGAVKLASEHSGDTTLGIVLTNSDSWDKWSWNWNVLGSSETGNTINTTLGTVKLSADDWYKIDVYFQPCLTADQQAAAADFDYGFAAADSFYDQYGLIFRVGNANQAASYYLDELSLTAVDGGLNPHFDNNGKYWNWNQTLDPQIVSFDAQAEGVADLVASGDFPNVSTVRKIAGHQTVGAVLPFEQRMAMQSGKSYEISMWVKGETTENNSEYSSEYCKFIPFWFSAGTNNVLNWYYYGQNWVQAGVTYARKGEWTNIKFILSNTISSLDGQFGLRYNADASTEINQDESATINSTFYVADVSIKEASDNLISNPHFINMMVYNDWSGKNPRSCDDPHYNSGVAETSGWTHNAGFSAKTNVENKTYVPDVTYDNSKAWGSFDLSNEDSDYVYQNCTLDSSKAYNFSAWVKTETAGNFAFVVGNSIIPAQTAVTRKGWSKITASGVTPSAAAEQPVGITMTDENGNYLTSGSFDFTDFTVKEIQENAVIDAITIGGLTADSPMTVNVAAASRLPYAGLYKYIVGSNTVETGRFNVGETIPALTYNADYLGSDIKLVVKPLSAYNTWGQEKESNVYTIPAESVDAEAELLSIEDSNGDIVQDIDGTSDVLLSQVSSVLGSVELTSGKAPAKAVLYLAGYDSHNKLVDVKISPVTIPANTAGQRVTTGEMKIEGTDITKVTVFVWGDAMTTLSQKVYAEK